MPEQGTPPFERFVAVKGHPAGYIPGFHRRMDMELKVGITVLLKNIAHSGHFRFTAALTIISKRPNNVVCRPDLGG